MLNKIKNSLVFQTNFLLLVSIAFIAALWIFFYTSQQHQQEEHNTSRYFNTVTSIQPMIFNKKQVTNEDLKLLGMKIYEKKISKRFQIVYKKGNLKKGFKLLTLNKKKILHLYNNNGEIYLEDIHKDETIFLIHLVFMFLLIFQTALYLKLINALNPLSVISKKLNNLEQGDLTPLEIDSKYEEIKQITNSYNQSISQIDYMLETKEMFNKIFMHEMKMPLAKGMFYLKLEPSKESHQKLHNILSSINSELEEFSQIESLISYKNFIDTSEHNFFEIFNIARSRALADETAIELKNYEDCRLKGDKEFWVLAIKNLINNALKYSTDKKLIIDCKDGISFINKGDPLPVDISKDVKRWKIDRKKRHKSSTGYGFGLFIIKNIVTLHNYKLEYNYDEKNCIVELKIV